MSKLKCSIYSHHKWIYCIFIKLNERNGWNKTTESSTYILAVDGVCGKSKFRNVLYVALWNIYDTHIRFMVPINFGRSQSNWPLLIRLKLTKLRNVCRRSKITLHWNSNVFDMSIKVLHETSPSKWQWNYRKCFYGQSVWGQMQLNSMANNLSIKQSFISTIFFGHRKATALHRKWKVIMCWKNLNVPI